MTNAVTGLEPEDGNSTIPESLKDLIKEAARRAAPKVRQAFDSPKSAVVLRLTVKPRDS